MKKINKKSKPSWLKPSKNLVNNFKYNSPFKIGKLKDNPKVAFSIFKTNRPAQITIPKKQMNWEQARAKYHLSPFGDADNDGVSNIFDCKPYNKARQGFQHSLGYKELAGTFPGLKPGDKIISTRRITEKEFKQNKTLSRKPKESRGNLSERRREIMKVLEEKPYVYKGRGMSKESIQEYRPATLTEALRTSPYFTNPSSHRIRRNENIDIINKELELQGIPHHYKPKKEKIIDISYDKVPVKMKIKKLKQEPKEIDEAYLTSDNVKDVVEDVTISEKIE